MKKLLGAILLCCLMLLVSCDDSTSNLDPSLEGIDLDKYEMPQTEFLNDGHELSNFELMAKYLIDNGTFCFEPTLDAIGYRIYLTTDYRNNDYYVAFYSINNIKIAHVGESQVEISSRWGTRIQTYQSVSYVKLANDDKENVNLCYKLLNTMGEAVYTIYETPKATFSPASHPGEYLLFRTISAISLDEETHLEIVVNECDNLFKLYNAAIGTKTSLPLSSIGFNNY